MTKQLRISISVNLSVQNSSLEWFSKLKRLNEQEVSLLRFMGSVTVFIVPKHVVNFVQCITLLVQALQCQGVVVSSNVSSTLDEAFSYLTRYDVGRSLLPLEQNCVKVFIKTCFFMVDFQNILIFQI